MGKERFWFISIEQKSSRTSRIIKAPFNKKYIFLIFFGILCAYLSIPFIVLGDTYTVEENTDRPGLGKIGETHFELKSTDDHTVCAIACLNNNSCEAYTYVKAGYQGNKPQCWLKKGVPDPVSNKPCCVSGVKKPIMAVVGSIPSIIPISTFPLPKSSKNNLPKIQSISSYNNAVCGGLPVLTSGKEFTIKGSNFGSWINKAYLPDIQIGYSKNVMEHIGDKDPLIPPRTANLLVSEYPNNVTDTKITAYAPVNMKEKRMYVWLYRKNVGYSNAILVEYSAQNSVSCIT